MYPLRLLQHILPIILVEQRRVSRSSRATAILPLDRRLARREDAREEGGIEQRDESLPMPHHSQLLKNVSKGLESCVGDCGDQEEYGLCELDVYVQWERITHMNHEAVFGGLTGAFFHLVDRRLCIYFDSNVTKLSRFEISVDISFMAEHFAMAFYMCSSS